MSRVTRIHVETRHDKASENAYELDYTHDTDSGKEAAMAVFSKASAALWTWRANAKTLRKIRSALKNFLKQLMFIWNLQHSYTQNSLVWGILLSLLSGFDWSSRVNHGQYFCMVTRAIKTWDGDYREAFFLPWLWILQSSRAQIRRVQYNRYVCIALYTIYMPSFERLVSLTQRQSISGFDRNKADR